MVRCVCEFNVCELRMLSVECALCVGCGLRAHTAEHTLSRVPCPVSKPALGVLILHKYRLVILCDLTRASRF